jgi:hypothetical protein
MQLRYVAGALFVSGLLLGSGAACHRAPQVTMPTAVYPVPPPGSAVAAGGGGEAKKKGDKAKEEKPAQDKEPLSKDGQPSSEKNSDSPKDAQPSADKNPAPKKD